MHVIDQWTETIVKTILLVHSIPYSLGEYLAGAPKEES